MVDLFPVMNYLPAWMAKWKRDALEWHERESKMFEGFYTDVNKKMVSIHRQDLLVRRAILNYTFQVDGQARKSFVSSLIEGSHRNQLSLKEAAWLAGIMLWVSRLYHSHCSC